MNPISPAHFAAKQTGLTARLLAGRRRAVAAGRRPAGTVPFGYRAAGTTLEIHPEEAEIVRRMFRLYLTASIQKIERLFAAEGLRTRRGKRWSKAGVAWILNNRTYIGESHMGPIRHWAAHPPLIAMIVFAKVKKRLGMRRKDIGRYYY